MKGRGIVMFALAFATSCASAPKVARPELEIQAPERWGVETVPSGEVGPVWWSDFGDAQLSSAVEEALAGNYDLLAAAARVEQAAARARIAGADLKPKLSAGFSGSRRRQNFIGLPIPGSEGGVLSTTFTSLGVSLDVSWEVDLWGRLRARARAALADFEASEVRPRGARLSLAGQTAKAWFAIAEAAPAGRAGRGERSRASGPRRRRSAARYERGLRPALDLRLALANLAGAEAALDAAATGSSTPRRASSRSCSGATRRRRIETPAALPDTPAADPGRSARRAGRAPARPGGRRAPAGRGRAQHVAAARRTSTHASA